MASKKRLDVLLVERKFFETRQRAQAAIMSGAVLVDGQAATKAGTFVSPDAELVVQADMPYVGRGGLKLAHALEHWQVQVQGLTCLDVGASTGGFTDCLLQKGAAKVIALDVGYGQLAWSLRQDPRVVVMERTNIRHVEPKMLGEPIDLVVIDVSFISITKFLDRIKTFLQPQGQVLSLVKPQFEAGPKQVSKGGLVKDPVVHRQVLEGIAACARECGFEVQGFTYSPIRGAKGNIEYFIYLTTDGRNGLREEDLLNAVAATVEEAHRLLE